MAWLSMIAGLLFPLLILGTDDPNLGLIAAPFYMFVGAVVGAYIGFATWDDRNVRFENNGYSGGKHFDSRNRSRLDDERMEAEWPNRPPEGRL
jgi:hypothetical protein